MFGNNINLVATSSAGRIFDAVSAIIGLNQIMEFEGQAAMLLEFQITDNGLENRSVKNGEWSLYPFLIDKGKILWQEMILNIIRDKAEGLANARIARKFHDTMIQIILQMAQLNQEAYQDQRVVLSGGCFQNRYLLEGVIARLTENGFQPYWHQRVPANDGGLCLGQLLIANQLSDIEKTMMERG
jgi:hydrogenase maturation protein HypF